MSKPTQANKSDTSVSVWLLTVLNSHGTELYVCRDEAVARRQLYEYVAENWPWEWPMADNPDEAISDFFLDNEKESYILVEEEVLTSPVEWE